MKEDRKEGDETGRRKIGSQEGKRCGRKETRFGRKEDDEVGRKTMRQKDRKEGDEV